MSKPIFSLILILIFFNINDVKAQQDPVSLYAGYAKGLQGDTVSIDIKVNSFTDIISFQASINWDATLLEYVGVTDFGIKDLGESNFGTTTANQGHVRFLWEPADANALTVEDSTILFSAQFKLITDIPQEIQVGFTDNISTPPYPIEFANSNFEILTVNTYDGSITLVSDPKDLVNLESVPNTSCDEKVTNGSLKADVNGDSINYTFHWFIGNTVTSTPNYIGYRYDSLLAGEYTLQILDGKNEIFVESMPAKVIDELNQQKDVISIILNNAQISCSIDSAKQTGLIEINVNDAQPADTYLISWWKGSFEDGIELTDFMNLYKATNLFAGAYEVSVENNRTGCKSYLKDTIMDETPDLQIALSSTENNFCKDDANGSASVSITNPLDVNPRYYWFHEDDELDTAQARSTAQVYENITYGKYISWVIDLNSDCFASDEIVVDQNLIYSEATIIQRNDTLFSNDDRANWFRNDKFLEETGSYLVPGNAGSYHIIIDNEYGCLSTSEALYYGVTGLEELEQEIIIFPNPFSETIRISNPDKSLEFVKIFDTQGILIYEKMNIKDKFIDLHLSNSPNGIYLLKIQKDGKIVTRKIIKNLSK